MSISLNSTSKWKARNMPSSLAYIEEQKQLPKCLTMSLAAYIAFYSSDIQAVSYTHLDVYKRQILELPMLRNSAAPPLYSARNG